MQKDFTIRNAKSYFVDTLPCEYEPKDDRSLKMLSDEEYYKSYTTGRGSDA
tara:strand:+ start:250 stop:402 length:153 start_codon:yes stop_codon:yes gene_type:complete